MELVHGASRRIACVRIVFVCGLGRWAGQRAVRCVQFEGFEYPDTQPGKVVLAHHRAARSSFFVGVRVHALCWASVCRGAFIRPVHDR
jgi:hypothetical protein